MTDSIKSDFQWQTEQFADIRILRYQVEGFEQLGLQQKLMTWYLYKAALAGRDIIYDQNYKYNLTIRHSLEAILVHYRGDKKDNEWKAFEIYLKCIWFSNGIHHHNSMEKFVPGFSVEFFKQAFFDIREENLPLLNKQSPQELYDILVSVIFDPTVAPKRLNQEAGIDMIVGSACNFYDGLTQEETIAFYDSKHNPDDNQPISHGLNSKLVKQNGKIKELVYKSDGRYGKAIRKIVIFLEKAKVFSETELQRQSIDKLIEFYETGDLKAFDEYSILWVQDTLPEIDFVNGFIEVYGDPLGYHGSWQSVVSMRDEAATKRFSLISDLAAWCEENSPIADEFKREDPKGVSYKVIQVIVEAGDNAPTSPIGVNLPNADWIRSIHGSKSVSMGNIEDAYEMSSKNTGSIEEFYLPEQQERIKKYGQIASKIHVGLHEVIGHGSGKLRTGVKTPKETLKSYSNTIEEARADLVAMYFITDKKLIDIGLANTDEIGKAAYDSFILNGLMRQLVRVEPGCRLEESHMRNRQLMAAWVFEKGKSKKIIEKQVVEGKTFFKINDYKQLRRLFGDLLKEVQRIKSEGDFEAAKMLVETYGVNVDIKLHTEVLERWKKLNIAPFAGFIQPQLSPIKVDGRLTEVNIFYPDSFTEQMLYYAENHSFLSVWND